MTSMSQPHDILKYSKQQENQSENIKELGKITSQMQSESWSLKLLADFIDKVKLVELIKSSG